MQHKKHTGKTNQTRGKIQNKKETRVTEFMIKKWPLQS